MSSALSSAWDKPLAALGDDAALLRGLVTLQQEMAKAEGLEALRLVSTRAAELLGFTSAAVTVLEDGVLRRLVGWGEFLAEGGVKVPTAGTITERALREGKVCWSNDMQQDARLPASLRLVARQAGLKKLVAAPFHETGVIGVLQLATSTDSALESRDLFALELLAGMAGGAVVRLRGEEKQQALLSRLQTAEARFSAFQDLSPVLSFIKDAGGRYTYVNAAMHRAFGVRVGDAYALTSPALCSTGDGSALAALEAQVLATGRSGQVSVECRTASGTVRSLLVTLFPMGSERDGISIGGKAMDVTDQQHAAEQWAKSAALVEAFYESAPMAMGIVELNADGFRYVSVNGSTARLHGLRADEMLGKSAQEMGAAEGPISWARRQYQRALDTRGPVTWEYVRNEPAGPRFMKATTKHLSAPGLSDQAVGFVVEDITAEVVAQQAEQRQQAILESFFRASHLAMGIMEVQGGELTVIKANPVAAALWDTTPDQAEGRRPADLGSSPENVALWARHARAARASGHPVSFEYLRANGRHLATSLCAIPMSDGAANRVCFVVEDVTERTGREAQVHRSLQEKELLLREVHHRVKNNLAVVTALLSLQARNCKEASAREALTNSQTRVRAIAAFHEKAYQAKDLARIPLAQYLRSVVSPLVQAYGFAGSQMRFEGDCDLVLGVDQAIPCGLVVNELVANALKYAFPEGSRPRGTRGTVVLRIEPTAGATGWDGPSALRLSVRDDGVGLPADFNPTASGSLGMQIIRTLSAQLGADLTFTREAGTCVALTFPIAPAAAGGKP